MYDYQKNNRYFAQIAEDIKELGTQELAELGAGKITPAYRGIYFSADMETLYRITYSVRLFSRILAPLVSFTCSSTDQLYKKARQVSWTDFLDVKDTFAVFGNVSDSTITHSHYASLLLKDGIVDSFRDCFGKRPNVDAKNPDVWFNIYIRNDRASISLDLSGGSLHRRGFRPDAVSAPMQETVASAIIRYTEWDGSVPLYDPMFGSGTLLTEALLHYCRIPSGILREQFGFEFLPDYKKKIWANVVESAGRNIRELPAGVIAGSDLSPDAVAIARSNIKKLRYGERIKLKALDFRKIKDLEPCIVVANPPYGIRMGDSQDLNILYKELGDFLKQKCKGSTAYIYFGERELIKKIGLKPAWKKPLKSGGLDGRLVKYEMY
jgi:putative N6-adenine-specific DNA methylase